MNWYVWLIIGFALGYIAKDLLTIEKKVEVNIGKQKVRGKGNKMDTDYDVQVEEKKERRKLFGNKKKTS